MADTKTSGTGKKQKAVLKPVGTSAMANLKFPIVAGAGARVLRRKGVEAASSTKDAPEPIIVNEVGGRKAPKGYVFSVEPIRAPQGSANGDSRGTGCNAGGLGGKTQRKTQAERKPEEDLDVEPAKKISRNSSPVRKEEESQELPRHPDFPEFAIDQFDEPADEYVFPGPTNISPGPSKPQTAPSFIDCLNRNLHDNPNDFLDATAKNGDYYPLGAAYTDIRSQMAGNLQVPSECTPREDKETREPGGNAEDTPHQKNIGSSPAPGLHSTCVPKSPVARKVSGVRHHGICSPKEDSIAEKEAEMKHGEEAAADQARGQQEFEERKRNKAAVLDFMRKEELAAKQDVDRLKEQDEERQKKEEQRRKRNTVIAAKLKKMEEKRLYDEELLAQMVAEENTLDDDIDKIGDSLAKLRREFEERVASGPILEEGVVRNQPVVAEERKQAAADIPAVSEKAMGKRRQVEAKEPEEQGDGKAKEKRKPVQVEMVMEEDGADEDAYAHLFLEAPNDHGEICPRLIRNYLQHSMPQPGCLPLAMHTNKAIADARLDNSSSHRKLLLVSEGSGRQELTTNMQMLKDDKDRLLTRVEFMEATLRMPKLIQRFLKKKVGKELVVDHLWAKRIAGMFKDFFKAVMENAYFNTIGDIGYYYCLLFTIQQLQLWFDRESDDTGLIFKAESLQRFVNCTPDPGQYCAQAMLGARQQQRQNFQQSGNSGAGFQTNHAQTTGYPSNSRGQGSSQPHCQQNSSGKLRCIICGSDGHLWRDHGKSKGPYLQSKNDKWVTEKGDHVCLFHNTSAGCSKKPSCIFLHVCSLCGNSEHTADSCLNAKSHIV